MVSRLKWIPQAATFWGREAAVDRLAERGELQQLIGKLSAIRHKAGRKRVMFVVAGHSLGGRAVYRTLRPLMQNAVAAKDYAVALPPVADLAVMVNPALTADDHKTLADMVNSTEDAGSAVPRFLIATSQSDSVLRKEFRWSRLIATIVRGHNPAKSEDRTTALGLYKPYITHRLDLEPIADGGYVNSNGNERCESMKFDELDIVQGSRRAMDKAELTEFRQIVHIDGEKVPQYKTVLTDVKNAAGPLMVVSVDGKIISSHNDIFTAPFVDFVARVLNKEFFRKDDASSKAAPAGAPPSAPQRPPPAAPPRPRLCTRPVSRPPSPHQYIIMGR